MRGPRRIYRSWPDLRDCVYMSSIFSAVHFVSEGVFAEILWKIRGDLQKVRSIASGMGAEFPRKVYGNFGEICGNFSAMTPSRTTP